MIGNRKCAFALSAASAIICSAPPAIAANFDGNWSMAAVTTRGHCGNVEIGLGIDRGRIHSTGGSFAFYAIQLGGRVSASGHVRMSAVAGPRTAHGTGRFGRFRGSGTWAGRGPSGLCQPLLTHTFCMAERLAHVTRIDATLPLSSASSGVIGEAAGEVGGLRCLSSPSGAVDEEVHRVRRFRRRHIPLFGHRGPPPHEVMKSNTNSVR